MEDAAEDGREVVGEADDANGEVGQDAVEPQRQEQLEDGHAQAALEPVDLADDRVEPARARGASEELQMVRVGWGWGGGGGIGVRRGENAGSGAEQAGRSPPVSPHASAAWLPCTPWRLWQGGQLELPGGGRGAPAALPWRTEPPHLLDARDGCDGVAHPERREHSEPGDGDVFVELQQQQHKEGDHEEELQDVG